MNAIPLVENNGMVLAANDPSIPICVRGFVYVVRVCMCVSLKFSYVLRLSQFTRIGVMITHSLDFLLMYTRYPAWP